MPIKRTFDATFLNAVANDAAVRPWLQGEGAIDLGPVLADARNIGLVTDGGGFVCVLTAPGEYEVHSMFLRGVKTAGVAVLDALDYAFTRTDAVRLTTKVPDNNHAAAALAGYAGFVSLFHNDVLGFDCLELTLDRWAMRTEALQADGEWFHMAIDAASTALPEHPADAMHDRAVGAAVRMCRAGNAAKGVGFYNRWAVLAGYPLARLVALHPPIIDMGEAVVAVHGADMEVLSCQ